MTDISRRAVIGATGPIILAALAGCTRPVIQNPVTPPAEEGSSDMSTSPETAGGTRMLLVYYSRAGENYWEGGRRDLSGYGAVVLGSPVWNTRAPMIIRTFLDRTDSLAGMTVHPFLTYAVGQGSVFEDYADLCPEADVRAGLAIRGEEVRDSADAIDTWLRESALSS